MPRQHMQQSRLPGIGFKYDLPLGAGGRMSVIQHNDGTRQIYFYRDEADDSPASVATLDDEESRQLGATLGGAYERPKIVEELEMALGELLIEWLPVPDTSPAIGRTLADCAFRARTGVTVVAILREPQPISGAQPGDVIEQGDTLVVVGKKGDFARFREVLAEGPLGQDER